jgi:TPR repeat protein
MYYNGEGAIRDNVYAHMWANIAASQGSEHGELSRDGIAEGMTTEQIAEAQKLARACVQKEYKGC